MVLMPVEVAELRVVQEGKEGGLELVLGLAGVRGVIADEVLLESPEAALLPADDGEVIYQIELARVAGEEFGGVALELAVERGGGFVAEEGVGSIEVIEGRAALPNRDDGAAVEFPVGSGCGASAR